MQGKPQNLELSYRAPFGGINSQDPKNMIQPTEAAEIKNFILRNKRIMSAPRFKRFLSYIGENEPVRGLGSFLDFNNVTHTLGLTANNAYQLNYLQNADGTDKWVWNQISTFAGDDFPYAILDAMGNMYWTNPNPGLFYWDGIASQIKEATNYTNGLTYDATKPIYGANFLGELAFHIIMLNTVEKDPAVSTNALNYYPQRIRWSASGTPTSWNAATAATAGFNDQIDVPDNITGFITIGRYGYVFRTNGITQMIPTGIGQRPFTFDHLWASNQGIGNIIGSTIGFSSYGSVAIFISLEQIYQISSGGIQAIGKGVRDAILKDLNNAYAGPVASITPAFSPNFIYLNYMLAIPMNGFTVVWTYNIEDQSWIRRVVEDTYFMSAAKYIWVK